MKRLIVATLCLMILALASSARAEDVACYTEHWRLNCQVEGRNVSWAIGFVHYDLQAPFPDFPWKGGVKVGCRTKDNMYSAALVAHQHFADKEEANAWVNALENNFNSPKKVK